MSTHIKLITCTSYLEVATQLLPYMPSPHLFVYETEIDNQTTIILSNNILGNALPDSYNDFPELAQPIRTPSRMLNTKICYSFRIADLSQKSDAYRYLCETILTIPYIFTKAVLSTDSYGNELLLLLN